MRRFLTLMCDDRGVAAIEYALIALFIVCAGITTWGAMTSGGSPAVEQTDVRHA